MFTVYAFKDWRRICWNCSGHMLRKGLRNNELECLRWMLREGLERNKLQLSGIYTPRGIREGQTDGETNEEGDYLIRKVMTREIW